MSSESTINKRIQKIMETEKLNFRSFGMKLGVSDVVVRNIITGRNKPSYDFIQKIIQTFVWIDIEWFLTGEGEMLKKKEPAGQSNSADCSHLEKTIEILERQLDRQEREITRLTKFIDSLQRDTSKHKNRSD